MFIDIYKWGNYWISPVRVNLTLNDMYRLSNNTNLITNDMHFTEASHGLVPWKNLVNSWNLSLQQTSFNWNSSIEETSSTKSLFLIIVFKECFFYRIVLKKYIIKQKNSKYIGVNLMGLRLLGLYIQRTKKLTILL